MKRNWPLVAVCALLMILSAPAFAQSQPDKLSAINKDHSVASSEKLQLLSAEYDRAYASSESNISNLSNDLLSDLFRASDMLTNYTLLKGRADSLRYLKTVNLTIAELGRRGLADAERINAARRTNVAARQFQDAKRLDDTASLPQSMRSLPSFGRRVIAIDKDQNISVKDVTIENGLSLVVVSGCNVSTKAIRDIMSNSNLLNSLNETGAIWLMPPTSDLDVGIINEWNSTYSSQQIQMAFDSAEWPEIDFSIIPNFYIFKNGKVISHMSGWKGAESMIQLQDLLNEARN